jgi:nicotinamide mononucleotide transporter PnuC
MQFYGLYVWSKSLKKPVTVTEETSTVESKTMSLFQWILSILVTAIITVGFYYEIPVFSVAINKVYYFEGKFEPRFFDALCNGLSMVAQVLSIYCFADQWYWWILVDCVQIAMYTGIAGYGIVINVVVMWLLFLLNALAGIYAWYYRYLYPSSEDADLLAGSSDEENLNGQGDEGEKKDGRGYSALLSREGTGDDMENIQLGLNDEEMGKNKSSEENKDSQGNSENTHLMETDAYYTASRDPYALGNSVKGFLPPFEKQSTQLISQDEKHHSLVPMISSSQENSKDIRRGVIVGKFWPFHRGHQYLCEKALENCDELYIIICHRIYQQPSAAIRMDWIRKTIPSAYVMAIRDVYDPLDSHLWADLTKAWCHFTPNIVFTSELYGEKWANYLGCSHMLIDLNRDQFHISGTKVRELFYESKATKKDNDDVDDKEEEETGQMMIIRKDHLHELHLRNTWTLLPTIVKYYFMKQFIIFDASSIAGSRRPSSMNRNSSSNPPSSSLGMIDSSEFTQLLNSEINGILLPSFSSQVDFMLIDSGLVTFEEKFIQQQLAELKSLPDSLSSHHLPILIGNEGSLVGSLMSSLLLFLADGKKSIKKVNEILAFFDRLASKSITFLVINCPHGGGKEEFHSIEKEIKSVAEMLKNRFQSEKSFQVIDVAEGISNSELISQRMSTNSTASNKQQQSMMSSQLKEKLISRSKELITSQA